MGIYMGNNVAIGIQNFEKLRKGHYFYIDKTFFIKEWWESGDEVTLIARPRRFGKTLTMSMVEQFFSLKYAKREDLFQGLAIWSEEEYRQLQGTYPVISLSFASVKETNYVMTKKRIYQLLVNLYDKNQFLLASDILTENEREYFQSICMDMEDITATMAIHKMSDFLSRYYGKKVIILLDEYDTPMQEAYAYGFWNELVSFTRGLFNAAFKTNPFLERALMTGITRVSKESIFSDLNHLKVVTTTSTEYAKIFGFTEQEVFTALELYGLDGEKEEIKYWYDGFIFGNQKDIYNPWSILNYLDTKKIDTYWANTSSNHLVSKLVREGNKHMKNSFEQLLKGEVIRCPVNEQIVYEQLGDDETAVWSLLVASGYLKIVSYERLEDLESNREPLYELMLTNYEVRHTFFSMVREWFKDARTEYTDFIKAFLSGNLREMNIYMNRLTIQLFSHFDTGRGPFGAEQERFYHGFVLGLLTELTDRYIITSNRESGYGRYDVMLEPKKQEDVAFILEFKVHDGDDETSLTDTVDAALKQIENKQYETVLIMKGISKERIRKYGFAFEGKKVLIG